MGEGRGRHSEKGARRRAVAQGLCACAWVGLVAALLGGCAGAPPASSGAEARDRLLGARAAPTGPTRGVGEIHARVGDRRGSFEARWGAAGESLVVLGYAGPVHALDASLLRESIFIAIRPRELAITGVVRRRDGLGPDGVRLLLQPWDMSAPWIRQALERASVEPYEGGWRLRGVGKSATGSVGFTLDVTARGEPRSLSLYRPGDDRVFALVRYGPPRKYAAGKFPRWVEWTRADATIRLDVRDLDRLPAGRIRRLPPAPADWRVVSLDDPEGRKLLERMIGAPPESLR